MNGPTLVAVVLAACALGAATALVIVRAQRNRFADATERLRRDLTAQRETELASTIDTVIRVAGERLGAHTAHGASELTTTRSLIDQQLLEMRTDLRRVTGLVKELETSRAEQYGQLARQISSAGQQTQQLADTTRQLREALSSTTARGQWGERMAEDVLQLAGFLEGVNYVKQQRISSGGVPDFTFLLPRDMRLHMDVKFPLSNYLRYLEADGESDRLRLRKEFLRDARARVTELAGRDYIDPDTTVDCVLLFIPNEQLYAFIQEHDAGICETALRSKIVMCSPLTLFAVLAVVRQAADNFRLERASDEILSLLGTFAQQWQRYTDQVETLGTHLERSQKAYESLTGTRRRQLEKPLDRLEELRREREVPAGEAESARLRAVAE